MNSSVKTKILRISGMTCVNCQNKIEKKLRNTAGIKKAEVSWNAGRATVTYDSDIISLRDIAALIKKAGYEVLDGESENKPDALRVAGLFTITAALYLLLEVSGVLNLLVPSKLAEAGIGYGMLFVIGLITSVHCVAMCGGINLSQCIPKSGNESKTSALRGTMLYNLGRVISYTVIGFVVGALGSVITF